MECLSKLRSRAASELSHVMQMCLLPYERGGPYPGLFFYTQQGRVARPVRQSASSNKEWIGSLEQCNMHIKCVLLWCSIVCKRHFGSAPADMLLHRLDRVLKLMSSDAAVMLRFACQSALGVKDDAAQCLMARA